MGGDAGARPALARPHWHALNRLCDLLRSGNPAGGYNEPLAALPAILDRILLSCISLAGFAMDDMTRDAGWRYLILGRRIERLQHRSLAVARFLNACTGRPGGIDGLLELADSGETYRQRYRRLPDIVPTLRIPPNLDAPDPRRHRRTVQPDRRAFLHPRRRHFPDAFDMNTRYRVAHATEYRYAAFVQTARHLLHLSPRACPRQEVYRTSSTSTRCRRCRLPAAILSATKSSISN